MAQKDYVRRAGKSASRRKKGGSRQGGVPIVMIAVAVLVLVAFVGGLFFLAHQHKSREPAVETQNPNVNSLPPRPQERWRYIKELENRKPDVKTPARPTPDNDGKRQLTDEQRQLLDQIQADMRQQPTQLNEVPWNGQPVAPSPSSTPAPASGQNTPQVTKPEATNAPKPATGAQRWMVQCGSFKNTDQAQAVRAQLAFEGFEARISSNEGWQRVVMGPFNSKASVDSALSRLRDAGHTNCIRLLVGG